MTPLDEVAQRLLVTLRGQSPYDNGAEAREDGLMGRRRDNVEMTDYSGKYGQWEHGWQVPGTGEKVSWEQVGKLLGGRESQQVNRQEQPAASPRPMHA